MKNRIRYTVDKVLSNAFYQMPKFLFEGDCKKLSNDARVLYALLKDRHELSVKNEWYNDKKEVYLIMSRDEMEEMLNLSLPTIIKALKDLKNINLIEEERRGQGKANLLYLLEVKNFTVQTERNFSSRDKEFLGQDLKNFYPNNTNLKNHTDRSNTESINQKDSIDSHSIKVIVKDKIQLDHLQRKYPDKQRELQELYDIIVEVLGSRKKIMRIAKEDMPAEDVKQAFAALDYSHVEYVLESLRRNTTQVKSTKSYLQTTLFNAAKTINNHYSLSSQNFMHDVLGMEL